MIAIRASYFYIPLLGLSLVGCPKPSANTDAAKSFPIQVGVEGATKQGKFQVQIRSIPHQPPHTGMSTFEYRIQEKATGTLVTGAKLEVTPFMPAHGHGTTPTKTTNKGKGVYWVEEVALIMPGTWELRTVIRIGEQAEEGVFPVVVKE